MKTLAILLLVSTAFAAEGAMAAPHPAPTYKGHQLAASAHVTLTEARRLALQARPGVVTDQELEKEAGGSGLRYSFDIKAGGKTFEVGVDAQTGTVLENAAEGSHPD